MVLSLAECWPQHNCPTSLAKTKYSLSPLSSPLFILSVLTLTLLRPCWLLPGKNMIYTWLWIILQIKVKHKIEDLFPNPTLDYTV